MEPAVQVLPAPLPELSEGDCHYVQITFPGAQSGLKALVSLSGCVRVSDKRDSVIVTGTQVSGPTPAARIHIKATQDGCPTITVRSPDGQFAARTFNGVAVTPVLTQAPHRPPVCADYASEDIDFQLLTDPEVDDASSGPHIVGPPMLPLEPPPADRSAEEELMEDALSWLWLAGDPSPQYEPTDEAPSEPSPILPPIDQEQLMSKQGPPPAVPDPSATGVFSRDDLMAAGRPKATPPTPLTAEALAAGVDEDGEQDPSQTGVFTLPAPHAQPPAAPSMPPPSADGEWRARTDTDFTSPTGPTGSTPHSHPGDDMTDQPEPTPRPTPKNDDSSRTGWLVALGAAALILSMLGVTIYFSGILDEYVESDVLADAAVDAEVDAEVEIAPPPAELTMCSFVDPNRTEVGGKVQVTCSEGGPYWVIAQYEGAGTFTYSNPTTAPPAVD